jgi:hypothetical protein
VDTIALPMMLRVAAAAALLATAAHAAIDADKIANLPGWEKALPSPQCEHSNHPCICGASSVE